MLKHLKSTETWTDKSIANKGFTLIELLVVIVILGILGAVVVFSVRGVTNNSKTSSCKIEKRTLETAIEAYYANGLGTANTLQDLVTANLIRDTNTAGYTVSGGQVTGTCPS